MGIIVQPANSFPVSVQTDNRSAIQASAAGACRYGVDGQKAPGLGRHHQPAQGEMPAVPGVDILFFLAMAGQGNQAGPDRGRIVGNAEDQRLHAAAGAGDFFDLLKPLGGFDGSFDADR